MLKSYVTRSGANVTSSNSTALITMRAQPKLENSLTMRSMWKGSISFGLVNIPIAVYLVTEGREFSFNHLCSKAHKIRYKKWCPDDEREVSYSEIKKGYEIAKDEYIVIDKSDLDRIKLRTTNTIDVKEFVDEKEQDPILQECTYDPV